MHKILFVSLRYMCVINVRRRILLLMAGVREYRERDGEDGFKSHTSQRTDYRTYASCVPPVILSTTKKKP
jgi:hypothetical protein